MSAMVPTQKDGTATKDQELLRPELSSTLSNCVTFIFVDLSTLCYLFSPQTVIFIVFSLIFSLRKPNSIYL